jgi:hypothetical protein
MIKNISSKIYFKFYNKIYFNFYNKMDSGSVKLCGECKGKIRDDGSPLYEIVCIIFFKNNFYFYIYFIICF